MIDDDGGQQPAENRGIYLNVGPTPDEPVPLAEMLQHLEQLGLPDAEDRIYRWRRARILGDTAASGNGNVRLVLPRDHKRLETIAALHRQFAIGKVPNDELAFWLAIFGDTEMPTGLVMDAIGRGTRRFTSMLAQVFAKRVGGSWSFLFNDPHPNTVTKLSDSLANAIKRIAKDGVRAMTGLMVDNAAEAFITQLLQPTSEAAATKAIGQMLRAIGANEEQVRAWTPHVWQTLREVCVFFLPSSKNAAVVAANECREMSSADAAAVTRDAAYLYDMLAFVLPELKALRPERFLVPMIAGMLLQLRNHPDTIALRQRLEEQGLRALDQNVRQIIEVRRSFLSRFFGLEEVGDPAAAPARGTPLALLPPQCAFEEDVRAEVLRTLPHDPSDRY